MIYGELMVLRDSLTETTIKNNTKRIRFVNQKNRVQSLTRQRDQGIVYHPVLLGSTNRRIII